MIQERLEKKEEEFFLFALRLGKTQIVATVADKKNFSCHFHHNFVAGDNYDDGFLETVSLVVIFHCDVPGEGCKNNTELTVSFLSTFY